jgi:hypothetical protein
MKTSQNGPWEFTRRVFCWGIGRAVPAAAFASVSTGFTSLPTDEDQTSEYLIINGWVITKQDALSIRELR